MQINILVLAAGSSDNFFKQGYFYPKYLAEVHGKPLIEYVLSPLTVCPQSRILSVILNEDAKRHYLDNVMKLVAPKIIVLKAPSSTQGAACSALLAIEFINNDTPLVIVNGDQFLDVAIADIIEFFLEKQWHGGIVTFESIHPRWSYVRLNESGQVIETAEKRPISNHATAGFYFFSKGRYFVEAALRMIEKNAQVQGLYYVCPAYTEMILQQKRIGIFHIDRNQYFSLATPENVEKFSKHLEALKS